MKTLQERVNRMKRLLVSLVVAGAVAVAGCNTSGTGGSGTTHAGPGGTESTRHSSYGPTGTGLGTTQAATSHTGFPAGTNRGTTEATGRSPLPADTHRGAEPAPAPGARNTPDRSETFTLSGPLLPTVIKQGERKEITIKVSRGTNFKEGIALKVENPPKGLTVKPEKPKISAGDDEAKVTIEAAKDAPLGDQLVDIDGVPDNGTPTQKPLQIRVKVEKGGENK
jgi:hypothetical protein